MNKKILSQESLKIIACVTMLIDHIGAVFMPSVANYSLYYAMRVIGRIAFPIYCFLLAEGVAHTKNPLKYGLRLFAGILLAEFPFDLAFYGGFSWVGQSVMVTLFLGFAMAMVMRKIERAKLAAVIIFGFLAELFRTDYGFWGIAMIALFVLTREREDRNVVQAILLAVICWVMNSAAVLVLGIRIPIEIFAMAALIPIFCYSGKKSIGGKTVQTMFYLFYPVHLLVLYLISVL